MGFYLGASFILILFSSVLVFSYYSVAVKNTMTKAILMEKKNLIGGLFMVPKG